MGHVHIVLLCRCFLVLRVYSMLSEVFNLGCLKNTKIYLITSQQNKQKISKAVTKAHISCSLIPQLSAVTVSNA